MVNHRRPVKKTSENHQRSLWSHRFPSSLHRPYFQATRTDCEFATLPSHRFPRIEDNFDDTHLQPHTHDFDVHLEHGKRVDSFRVFGKRGNNLGINKAIARNGTSGVNAAIPLVGDIVIMRLGGPDGRSLISMRGQDAAMVDYVFESPAFRARLAAFQGPARRRLPNWLVVRRARAFPK
ncbi:hypothetical protein DFH07DRAFT_968046 [Mycena maculata]|uniref:Uncharacterized protein n=1 Tax=Mycena maculata TaxID=230809 RepID=A0AAD7I261_9AGAR|nr:hypothetical protein DFH07DRAFT_968046 [Mycena maculata]